MKILKDGKFDSLFSVSEGLRTSYETINLKNTKIFLILKKVKFL